MGIKRSKIIDEYLDFPLGTFDHIPHYAREEALAALLQVRKMEQTSIFRPGLYYIVLSDLCAATKASRVLGNELSQRRIETFILTCFEALGRTAPRNVVMPLREVGDAVLFIFSSFEDVYEWWRTMNSWLRGREDMLRCDEEISKQERSMFRLKAKTIVHVGEVGFSGTNIPLSSAINQIFKVEKEFGPDDLGATSEALASIEPLLRSLQLRPVLKSSVVLPRSKAPTTLYTIDNFEKKVKTSRKK